MHNSFRICVILILVTNKIGHKQCISALAASSTEVKVSEGVRSREAVTVCTFNLVKANFYSKYALYHQKHRKVVL